LEVQGGGKKFEWCGEEGGKQEDTARNQYELRILVASERRSNWEAVWE